MATKRDVLMAVVVIALSPRICTIPIIGQNSATGRVRSSRTDKVVSAVCGNTLSAANVR
jgi:hypothetical protein